MSRLVEEVRQRPRVELLLPRTSPLEQLEPGRIQLTMEARDEIARLGSQNVVDPTIVSYVRVTETSAFRSSPPLTVCSRTVPIPRT